MAACLLAVESGGASVDALRVATSRDYGDHPEIWFACLGFHQSGEVATAVFEKSRLTHFGLLEDGFAEQVSMSVSSTGGGGDLPRHTHAGPRSAGRRGPSSGDLELTRLNNRRFLPIRTTVPTSSFVQVLSHSLAYAYSSFFELQCTYPARTSSLVDNSTVTSAMSTTTEKVAEKLPSTEELKEDVKKATKSSVQSLRALVAGGVGGVFAVVVGHPFDLVKVRMQTAEKGVYNGAMDVLRKGIARDGLVKGLYAGVSAPLVGVTPMCKFTASALERKDAC
jgi:hypothetical protein